MATPKKRPSPTASQSWVTTIPGSGELIRVHLPTDGGDAAATIDVPARSNHSRLHAVRPFDSRSWRRHLGEYSDGSIRLAVTMWPDTDSGAAFPFYADLDHDAVVPLVPVEDDLLLSEQGEWLRFTGDEHLRVTVEDMEVTMYRATAPVAEDVTFLVSGETTALAGTLLKPAGEGPFPVVVIAHDSAAHQRDFYRLYAHALVRSKVAALVFDRQGHGESTGEPTDHLHANAAAVEAAMDFLHQREDAGTVGLLGIGAGMWTVPWVAARRPDVGFVAGINAPGVTMIAAEAHRRGAQLQAAGLDEALCTAAAEAWRIILGARTGGEPTAEQAKKLEAQLRKLRDDPAVTQWSPPVFAAQNPELDPLPPLGSATDTLAEWHTEHDAQWQYDPAESYRMISCPILLQYGGRDRNQPAGESRDRLSQALKDNGNDAVTVSTYDDAGHLLENVAADRGIGPAAGYTLNALRFAPGALSELMAWMDSVNQ